MVHVPIGSRTVVTVRARVIRDVACERCRTLYIYAADRKAYGQSLNFLWMMGDDARDAAQQQAHERLDAELAKAIEPIACPSCGWYQKYMVREARRRRGLWLVVVAFLAALVGAMVAAVLIGTEAGEPGSWFSRRLTPTWIAIAAFFTVAAAALVVRHFTCTRWDPNTDTLWKRKRQPKEKGKFMFKEDYDREYGRAAPAGDAAPPPTS